MIRSKPDAKGFTLVELLVAISITLFLSAIIYEMYRYCLQTYSMSNAQLKILKSYRTATDRLDLDLTSMVWKVNYINDTRYDVKPEFKAIHMGLFAIRFEEQTMGFYTSLRPGKVDRVIYYFNPAEPPGLEDNGIDDDEDDNINTQLYLMVDDRGSLMTERIPDEYIVWDASEAGGNAGVPHYHEDGTGANAYDKTWDPDQQWDPLTDTSIAWGNGTNKPDDGDLLCEYVRNINFRYAYIDPSIDTAKFQYATTWPYVDSDNDGKYDSGLDQPGSWTSDQTGYRYGDNGSIMNNAYIEAPGGASGWDQRKGMSFLTPPIAVTVEFLFKMGETQLPMSRTFYIYSSLWNEYLNNAAP